MDNLSEEQKKRMIEAGQAVLNMSHGVKNILQSVRSAEEVMDLALEKHDLKQAKRTWDILRQNLDRIQKLVLDTLKFGKDEAPNLQPCDFNRLVASVVDMVRPRAELRQVEISTALARHLPPVQIDAEQMTDVVMNLLINAVEAVDDKTGRVTVRTESGAGNQQAILHIADNGPGIEDTDKIFEPFYSTKPNVGAGLGLTIAKKIIQKHNGTIKAKSTPGKETVFTVSLDT